MKTIGIICEYNPFHNGHIYHINKIKEMFPDSTIVLVMSGNFTERGDASIINKWDKTDVALNNGIDLVIELPFVFATQSADIFAYGACSILNYLKVDYLVFGSESGDIDMLKNIDAKVTVMFSSQEEVGTRGASVGPYAKNVDEAIAVDVSFGWTPFCKKSDCGEIGKGPMIGFSPILDKKMSNALVSVAEKNGIPYQKEIMGGGHTGTNADTITVSESGIKTALISIPEKYMHSPIEVVDVTDVENTARLIAEYVKERAGEVNA